MNPYNRLTERVSNEPSACITLSLAMEDEPKPSLAGHFAPGEVIAERFLLEKELGAGGMGTVFAARRTDSVGERVAIKLISNPSVFERFEAEARVVARLRSPHTVRLIEFGRIDEGRAYIAMELLEGRTLGEALESGQLSARQALEVVRDVSLSVAEAHRAGVVHRDLKPSNIFLQRTGDREHVRVLDFGIARLLPRGALEASVGVGRTNDGEYLGTPEYSSPEQFMGPGVTPASDLYSLGVILYQGVLGRHPFHDSLDSLGRCALAHVRDPAPIPRPELAQWPGLADLLTRLLEKEPEQRPKNAEELVAELERILDLAGHGAMQPPVTSPRGGSLARRRDWLAVAFGAVVLSAALGWALLVDFGSDEPQPPSVEAAVAVAAETTSSAGLPHAALPKKKTVPPARRTVRWTRFESITGESDVVVLRQKVSPWRSAIDRCVRRFVRTGHSAVLRIGLHPEGASLTAKAPASKDLQSCLTRAGGAYRGRPDPYFQARLTVTQDK